MVEIPENHVADDVLGKLFYVEKNMAEKWRKLNSTQLVFFGDGKPSMKWKLDKAPPNIWSTASLRQQLPSDDAKKCDLLARHFPGLGTRATRATKSGHGCRTRIGIIPNESKNEENKSWK